MQAERDPIHAGDEFALDFPATLTAIVWAEADGGYSAHVPALSGCVTEADTLDGLRANLRDAAEGWVKAMTGIAWARGPLI